MFARHPLAILLMCLLAACQPMRGDDSPRLVLLPTRPTVVLPSPTRRPSATPWPTPALPTPSRPPGPTATATPDRGSLDWRQRSGLADGASQAEDWAQVQSQARAEARVVLYSDTARAASALESFLVANPGLQGEAVVLDDQDIATRLTSDLMAGRHTADLYLVSDPVRVLGLLSQRALWRYVPADLLPVLPPTAREPLLTLHWSALTLIYNPTQTLNPPVDNWWDVTRPAWRGRFVLPDPVYNERAFYLLVAMSQHAADLAQAYQTEFGSALVLDADCPDAGYQWTKAMLANHPTLLPGEADVAALVGAANAPQVLVGLSDHAALPKVARGELTFAPLIDVVPSAGLKWRTCVGIVDQAPHPQTAKLLVRWLLGDAQGGQGYAPWYQPGLYATRVDLADPRETAARQRLEPRLWELDAAAALRQASRMRDFVAERIGRPVGGR